MASSVGLGLVLALLFAMPAPGYAGAARDRFSAAGYFRLGVRPDLQGGWNRLGLWNLYGRLLNEGPWAALELKLDMLPPTPGTGATWASVHAKIEGGSVHGVDVNNGSLAQFNLTQLYVLAGNVLLKDVTWQLGTLHNYNGFGDLGLYDMRPTDLFYNTVGLSARYQNRYIELLLGVGDSGYRIRGLDYSAILTLGSSLRVRALKHLQLGVGAELLYEPAVAGNRYAPHRTPLPAGTTYEDFVRHRIVERYLELNPGMEEQFPNPESVSSLSYKLVAYLGFGNLGPLRWNNLFANLTLRHPDNSYVESVAGQDYTIYVKELTDQRYSVTVGDELQLRIIPDRLDCIWGALLGYEKNEDNQIAPSEENRIFYSTVLRLQYYLTRTLHLLTEGSLAQERSLKGNLWRAHFDSVFQSSAGLADANGLEFGDLDTRNTWQLKAGLVINPMGMGIFTRPSLRLLYGVQHSNMHNAFGNSFVETLDQFNDFHETADRHWHQVIALEAEAWF